MFLTSKKLAIPFEDFESVDDALAEDRLRLNQIIRTDLAHLSADQFSTWTRRTGPIEPPTGVVYDLLDLHGVSIDLARGLETRKPQPTLASALTMRAIRLEFIARSTALMAKQATPRWRTFTLIWPGWTVSPAELEQLTARQVIWQLRTHLNRAGILEIQGPFVAVIHGEYEPVSGLYVLHVHGWTTAEKAQALKRLRRVIPGYSGRTASGGQLIRTLPINDAARQLGYCVKPFWPAKGLRDHGDRRARDRSGRRINDPNHVQYLLWLDRQRLRDMKLIHDVWCKQMPASAEGAALYKILNRPFESLTANG